MKNIYDYNPTPEQFSELQYNYQPMLTQKLDELQAPFDQQTINEIILWKVNRYAQVGNEALQLINSVNPDAQSYDPALTGDILLHLLQTPGIRLPMASTILRFRNPDIYQIIDQRVYRMIYGEKLKLPTNMNDNIVLYFDYLAELRKVCSDIRIPFSDADRILYQFDRMYNLQNIDY